MSKTVKNLILKALEKGYANINGRMNYGWSSGELESKYQVRYDHETDTLELDHWGTNILIMDNYKTNPTVQHIYGQSKSDRDSLMMAFHLAGPNDYSVSYRPSLGELHCNIKFTGKKENQLFIV